MNRLSKAYLTAYRLDETNDDGFFSVVGSIYHSPEVQSLKQYEQHLDIDRLQHITSVSFLTYKICKHLNLDYASATRAATMHDLFYYDWRDGETGRWHKLHGYKHPKYAALNAKELYPALSGKERDIIRHHMWPLTITMPQSKEGFVVSLCDKYCATRELLFSLSPRHKQRFLRQLEELKK